MKKTLNGASDLLEPDSGGFESAGEKASPERSNLKVLEKEKPEWQGFFESQSSSFDRSEISRLPGVPTQTARALMHANRPWADLQAKSLIAYLPVIALTLQKVYPDYRKYSLEQICQNIQPGDPSIPFEERKKLLENSEQIFGEYGRLHYDILSWIRDMETQEDILINIELQLTSLTPQKLYNRLLVYLAQMIAFQKSNDRGFLNDRYEDLKPLRTLWIFPRSRQNLHVHLNETVQKALDLLEKALGPKGLPKTEKDMIRHLLKMIDIRLIFIDPNDPATIESDEVLTFVFQLFGQTDRNETIAYVQKEGIALEKEFLERMDRYEYCLMGLDKEERTIMRAEVDNRRAEVDDLREQNKALRQETQNLRQTAAEADRRASEADRRASEADRRASEADRRASEAEQELARLKMLLKEKDSLTAKDSQSE